jgi:hypothetical protein
MTDPFRRMFNVTEVPGDGNLHDDAASDITPNDTRNAKKNGRVTVEKTINSAFYQKFDHRMQSIQVLFIPNGNEKYKKLLKAKLKYMTTRERFCQRLIYSDGLKNNIKRHLIFTVTKVRRQTHSLRKRRSQAVKKQCSLFIGFEHPGL